MMMMKIMMLVIRPACHEVSDVPSMEQYSVSAAKSHPS